MFNGTVSNIQVAVDRNKQRYKYPQDQETEKIIGVSVYPTTVTLVAVNVAIPT